MEWREIEIFTTKEGLEPLTGCLNLLGINGFVVNDSEEFKAFTEDKSANWDYIDDSLLGLKNRENSVTCYLPGNQQGEELFEALKAELEALKERDTEGLFGRLEFKENSVKEEDWANNWKQYFKPFAVGKNLYVKPSWEEPADVGERRIIEIDPGSSFGTGQHETTRMCLEMLERCKIHGSELDAIAVSRGPGSFTGIRIGLATAKGLAIIWNKPVICVPTLYSFAFRSDIKPGSFAVPVFDARRSQVYAGIYKDGQEILKGAAYDIEDFKNKAAEIIGESTAMYFGDGCHLIDKESRGSQDAKQILSLAEIMYEKGELKDCFSAEPEYMRLSEAERKKNEAGKS